MNETPRGSRASAAATTKDLQRRTDRVEQILPTLATKIDLRAFATKEDLEAFATKKDLEAFATKKDLEAFATKEDLKRFATLDDVREEGERTRHHVDMRFEQLRDEIRMLADGFAATNQKVDRHRSDHEALDSRVQRHRGEHVALERRVTRLEAGQGGRKPRA